MLISRNSASEDAIALPLHAVNAETFQPLVGRRAEVATFCQ